ncbi:MAG: heme-binding domain-containing protein [Flavobacteriales bacterium]|nr:heme-binding domain-containing protein [Flavobacteriales bacterium]MCB9364471.1 heme-binding domain-containing protein [Flavobacteriales bacterium]
MKKKILIGVVLLLVIIQFFRIDKTNPEVIQENDFIAITNPPEEIAAIIKTSCYDCHSFETKYPWYTNISPIAWWVKHHINEGREELNFSEWGTFKEKRKKHKLEECIEMVEENEMPLESYLITHSDSKLSDSQKTELLKWFKAEFKGNKEPVKTELGLNNGEKWQANEATTIGITKMLEIINNNTADNQVTSLNVKGELLEAEMKLIFEKCDMVGEAHEQLHAFLLPLVKKFRALKEATNVDDFYTIEKEIKTHLESYNTYFK